jgi:mannose-6-phosphate isomerase-like protein (cupin superfamily)
MAEKSEPENWLVTLAEASKRLESKRSPDGKPYEVMMRHDSMHIGLYAPRSNDPQQPHVQDEVYVVMQGSGQFICGEEQKAFGRGDVLFVPAGVVHRFVDFSDDFQVWVVFYGTEGGETT